MGSGLCGLNITFQDPLQGKLLSDRDTGGVSQDYYPRWGRGGREYKRGLLKTKNRNMVDRLKCSIMAFGNANA